jgi:hypothetical protein
MATTPKKPRVSKTGITSGGRIGYYSTSKEASDLDPSIGRELAGNSLTALYLSPVYLEDEEVGLDDFFQFTVTDNDSVTDDDDSTTPKSKRVPQLSDISIVSNQVVYSASGVPTATVVVKIKNSSGVELKGMNARITLS